MTDKRAVQILLQRLQEAGVRDVVLSPGSRNAPLSVSLFGHPWFRTHVVTDERSAAFIALGMAQQGGKPVVLTCTSGTALLNYGPALAEAFYQEVPLIVASADRPPEWIDQGEGQSIRQTDVFRNVVRRGVSLAADPWDEAAERVADQAIRECILASCGPRPGPVHINIPFREPLYGTIHPHQEVRAASWEPDWLFPSEDLQPVRGMLAGYRRILVLAGQLPPDPALLQSLAACSGENGWAVMTESHSNLAHPLFISTIDRLMMKWDADMKHAMAPDLVITLGANTISRKVKAWLRESSCDHWSVLPSGECVDTFRRLKKVWQASPAGFLRAASGVPADGSYRDALLALHRKAAHRASEFMATAPHSDLSATARILAAVPAGTDIQMGNSAVVRYIQLFDTRPDLRYFSNRGVAGIDGTTSTALGAAWQSERPTLLVTGDIAFLYDSNAFWNSLRPERLKVVVLNNQGGGIFRIIEGPDSTPAMEAYFEAHHQRKASDLARIFGVPCREAADAGETESALDWLFRTEGPALVEIHTPRGQNARVLKQYFQSISEPIRQHA